MGVLLQSEHWAWWGVLPRGWGACECASHAFYQSRPPYYTHIRPLIWKHAPSSASMRRSGSGLMYWHAINNAAGPVNITPGAHCLQSGRPGRVVHVASKLHFLGSMSKEDPLLTQGYNSLSAYSRSKLAQVGELALR